MGINIDSSVITDKAELENSQLLPCLKRALDPRIPDLSTQAALVLRPVCS